MTPKIKDWRPRTLSEYSYGQQMTTEVVDRVGGLPELVAAPIVPSLQVEEDLGFDVKIPAAWVTLFLQYKVSAQLTRDERRAGRRDGSAVLPVRSKDRQGR